MGKLTKTEWSRFHRRDAKRAEVICLFFFAAEPD